MRIRADGYAKCFRCGWKGWVRDSKPTAKEIAEIARREKRKVGLVERIVGECKKITEGDPVDLYWKSRGIQQPYDDFPSDILYHPNLLHGPSKSSWPAAVALVRRPATLIDTYFGRAPVIGIHRTFLTHDGRKAPVEPVKMTLGDIHGNYVSVPNLRPRDEKNRPVWGAASETVMVCEGIEDGLALRKMYPGNDVIVALSANNMTVVDPPLIDPGKPALGSKYKRVLVCPDRDDVGQKCAAKLIDFLEEGHREGSDRPSFEVKFILPKGKDFAEDAGGLDG